MENECGGEFETLQAKILAPPSSVTKAVKYQHCTFLVFVMASSEFTLKQTFKAKKF